MKRLTIVALSAIALSGCAGSHIKPAAVCDGKHRRPANLYGTILPSLPVPLPASQQGAGQSMVVPSTGTPGPAPAPPSAPDRSGASQAPIGPGALNTSPSAPRLSQRDRARSYSSC